MHSLLTFRASPTTSSSCRGHGSSLALINFNPNHVYEPDLCICSCYVDDSNADGKEDGKSF